MAEFVDTRAQKEQRACDDLTADGVAAFGQPVPVFRKDAAEMHCRAMGWADANKATGMINRAADAIERDQPYQAMEALTAYMDLAGAYPLLAVLCTAVPECLTGRMNCRDPKMNQTPKARQVCEEWGF